MGFLGFFYVVFFLVLFIYLAVLGLPCCTGCSLVMVHWLLIVAASVLSELGLSDTCMSVVAAPGL